VPQAFFVDRVAAGRVQVEVMIPPGASPATYQPTLEQMKAFSKASLYVKVGHPGFPFERTWLDRLLAERPGLTVLDAFAGLAPTQEDPHLWVSPRRARVMAREIAAALTRLLPQQESAFAANLQRLHAEIDALDLEIRRILADARGKSFLVFHPAWEAFARDYGLQQLAIERHGKEPDAKALADLIAQARAAGVKCIFVQPQFDPQSARTVARELGARIETLDPLAYDWPANLRRVAQALADASRA
jgi:zinc transport system substrate-binding protein